MNFFYDFLNQILPTPGTAAWRVLVEVLMGITDHFLLFCLAVYGLTLLRRMWRSLASMPEPDRAVQGVPLVKRTVTRFGVIGLMGWGAFSLVGYGFDAMDRHGASDCQRKTSPDFMEHYYAELCEVRGDMQGARSLLRLYDAHTKKLLAEAFVSNSEGELEWRKTRINEQGLEVPFPPYIVQGGGLNGIGAYGVSIPLPPPWWDRLKARLP